jgi:hypothetical protein
VTRREQVIQGLIAGGMDREEASALVKELCRDYESKGRREGYDSGYQDGSEDYF